MKQSIMYVEGAPTSRVEMKHSRFFYKGYFGSIKISIEDECFYGKILFTNDLFTYEADALINLRAKFEEAVDYYQELKNETNL